MVESDIQILEDLFQENRQPFNFSWKCKISGGQFGYKQKS